MKSYLAAALLLISFSVSAQQLSEKQKDYTEKVKAIRASLIEQSEAQREYLKDAYRNDKARNHSMVYMEVSQEGYFKFVCDHIPSQLGFYKSEMYGKKYTYFLHPDDLQPSLDASTGSSIYATNNTYKGFFWNRYRTKWGEYKYFWWKINWIENDGTSYHIAEIFTEDEWHELQDPN